MPTQRSPKLGALLTIAAVTVFGLQDGVSKHLTEQCGSIQEFVGDAVGDASEFRFDGSER